MESVGFIVVAVAIVAFGLTAYPCSLWSARRLEAHAGEMPVRLPYRKS